MLKKNNLLSTDSQLNYNIKDAVTHPKVIAFYRKKFWNIFITYSLS